MLGSARPLGSTVRLRHPAQGRQTGLRTSVLPWRTGSRTRRYGTEPLPTACLLPPIAQTLPFSLSLSLPDSLSANSHPPCQATQLFLAPVLPPCRLHPIPQTRKKPVASPSSRAAVIIWLSDFFFFLLFLNLARVGEEEAGARGGGRHLPAGWCLVPERERRGPLTSAGPLT